MYDFGGNGQAGPVVVGNRVFALCEPAQLYCFDKASGEVLWHVDTGDTDIWTTPHLCKTLKYSFENAERVSHHSAGP